MKKTSHSVGEARRGEARREKTTTLSLYHTYQICSTFRAIILVLPRMPLIVLALARIPVPPAPAEGRSINLTATTTTTTSTLQKPVHLARHPLRVHKRLLARGRKTEKCTVRRVMDTRDRMPPSARSIPILMSSQAIPRLPPRTPPR